jgi:hypothetical protein
LGFNENPQALTENVVVIYSQHAKSVG